MEIKINGNSIDELAAKIEALFALFNRNPAQAELPLEVNAGPVQVITEKKAAVKKTTKKDVEAEVKVEAPVTEKVFTIDDVKEAAQKLTAAKNIDAARNVLAQFKNASGEACRRISDVQESDFGMFVKVCDEASL